MNKINYVTAAVIYRVVVT